MAIVEQPAGLVTLVFTDLEGSTRLLRRLGEAAYRQALTTYRDCVRTAFGRQGGYEVDAEGDGFFYAFASAPEAACAVTEAMTRLEGGPMRMRVGIHSGSPGLDPPKYVGLDVHKAARVMAAGHGGQVLVSHATGELIGDRFALRYLGDYRLKDLELPERIYQLGGGVFPPLRTLYHSNLPTLTTSFVGRDRELAEVAALVRDRMPLVTLVGPGGSGKTRLALEVAAALSEDFPDGVWWVPLVSLRDPALVLAEVARVVGVEGNEGDPAHQLGDVLGGKRLLLVLDNAEHLLPGAASPLTILRDLGGPTLLVTSRERVQLTGEQVYQVLPLAPTDGLTLFELRARAIDPSFQAEPVVEELCAQLDQLPLAIELAAARTASFAPEHILRRLSQRLDVLAGGRDADARQRTLRATIEWSHALLAETEAALFAKLGIFSGGCTLEAAEEICEANLVTLAALVDKSLVRRRGDRFWLLETIRQYAAERLHTSEGLDELRRRHADFYVQLAAEAKRGMEGAEYATWLERGEEDLPNVRDALTFLFDQGDASVALRLSTDLRRLWAARSAAEGLSWLDRALATGAGTRAERGRGFLAAASLASLVDFGRLLMLGQEAIVAAERAGDPGMLAAAYGICGLALAAQHDFRSATDMMRRARELAQTVDDPMARAMALHPVSGILFYTGHLDEAEELMQELLCTYRELGAEVMPAEVLGNIGSLAMARGRYDEAVAPLEESLEIARRLRLTSHVKVTLCNLGLVAVLAERYHEALPLLDESLRLAASAGDRRIGAEAVLGLAAAHAALGNYDLAVKLDAIAQNEGIGPVEPAEVRERLEVHVRAAREAVPASQDSTPALAVRSLTLQTAITELASHSTHGLLEVRS